MTWWETIKFILTDERGFGGGGGGYRSPAAAPPPPTEEDPAVQKRKAARMSQQRYAQGFASTIATDRMALGGTQTPDQPAGQVQKLG